MKQGYRALPALEHPAHSPGSLDPRTAALQLQWLRWLREHANRKHSIQAMAYLDELLISNVAKYDIPEKVYQ